MLDKVLDWQFDKGKNKVLSHHSFVVMAHLLTKKCIFFVYCCKDYNGFKDNMANLTNATYL